MYGLMLMQSALANPWKPVAQILLPYSAFYESPTIPLTPQPRTNFELLPGLDLLSAHVTYHFRHQKFLRGTPRKRRQPLSLSSMGGYPIYLHTRRKSMARMVSVMSSWASSTTGYYANAATMFAQPGRWTTSPYLCILFFPVRSSKKIPCLIRNVHSWYCISVRLS